MCRVLSSNIHLKQMWILLFLVKPSQIKLCLHKNGSINTHGSLAFKIVCSTRQALAGCDA